MFKKCLSWLLLATLTVGADQLYVRNKAFKGYLTGSVSDLNSLEVDAVEIAKTLGFNVEEIDGNWVVRTRPEQAVPQLTAGAKKLYIGGHEVAYRVDYDRKLVRLREVAKAVGGRVVRHANVGTIDFDMIPEKKTGYDPTKYHLIFYGADWAPASKLFKPVVIEVDLREIVPVIYVDCNQPRSANYKNFIRYFNGDKIPYTVLLDPKSRVIKTWTGYHDLGPFSEEVKQLTNQ